MEVDSPKAEELFRAAEAGDSQAFRSLSGDDLQRARSLRNEDGRSLLHVAASFGHAEVCLPSPVSIPFKLFFRIFFLCFDELLSIGFLLIRRRRWSACCRRLIRRSVASTARTRKGGRLSTLQQAAAMETLLRYYSAEVFPRSRLEFLCP